MFISNDIRYIGVNDHQVTLFEGQYDVPLGMAYNSYVILDEKIAVMDTVDAHFGKEWLANLTAALAGRTPDYLVVQHMDRIIPPTLRPLWTPIPPSQWWPLRRLSA